MYVIIIYRVITVLLCIIVVVVLQIHLHFRKVAKAPPRGILEELLCGQGTGAIPPLGTGSLQQGLIPAEN